MRPEISEMTLENYEDVVALWESCEGLGTSETREEFACFLRRNLGFSAIARDGVALVGGALCGHDGRRGYLYHVAVAQSHRGQGLGRALVEWCLQKLDAIGIPRCSIHVYTDNDDGELFWLNAGWRVRTDLKVMAIDLPLDET